MNLCLSSCLSGEKQNIIWALVASGESQLFSMITEMQFVSNLKPTTGNNWKTQSLLLGGNENLTYSQQILLADMQSVLCVTTFCWATDWKVTKKMYKCKISSELKVSLFYFFLPPPTGSSSWGTRVRNGPWCVKTRRKHHVTSQTWTCTTWASTCSAYEPAQTGAIRTGCWRNSAPIKMVRKEWDEDVDLRTINHLKTRQTHFDWQDRGAAGKKERATTKWCR